jgi:ankyrin repeat protein
LQLHFQKRLDGWAINDNIVGYTFDTLALAVDFTDGKAYMLAEDAVRLALGNIPDENIITVSGVSVSKGDMQVILVDAETLRAADINKDFALTLPAPDKPKISDGSIIAAAAKGDAASIRRLLDAGHDINEIEPATGDNALFKAIKRGDEPLADLLIKAGITAGYANAAQQTALQLAAGRAQYRTARALLQAGASANGADILGNTPLLYAIQSGDTDVLELLLKAGAMANVNDGRGRSALALAVELGNMPQVELLLKHGSRDADNAMSTALRTGDASMVERLLAAGASVNRVDSVGNSLLHTAIFNGDNAIAQQLLANGANIDTQNVEGQTPLMFAVMQHNEDVAKALLARGANIYLTDKAGHSVMDIAAATDWDAVHMLEDGIRASQGLEQQFFDKVALGDYAAVRAFLDMEGAWTESENPITGNTALFLAVANNDKDMAYLLLARGADANRQNRKGNTPLMMAVQGADESLFDMLLEAGAQPDMQNASGDTALIVAAKLGRLNIARKLLLANADPNLRNFNGARPLAVAQGENARDVEQMLRSFGAY